MSSAADTAPAVLKTYEVPHGTAEDVALTLQKATTKLTNCRISAVGARSLLVYGSPTVQDEVQKQLDNLKPRVPIKFEKPLGDSLKLRESLLAQTDGKTPAQGTPQKQGDPNKPVSISAFGNRIIITSEDQEALNLAQQMIRLLTQTPEGVGDFEVIRLKYASAEDAAKILNEAFNGPPQQQQQQRGGGGGGFPFGGGGFPFGAIFGGGGGMMGGGGGGNRGPGGGQQQTPAKPDRVRVVADPGTNTLLVWASPLDLLTIRSLLDTAIDSGDSDSSALIRTWTLGPLQYASASDVALVLKDVYAEQMNASSSGSQQANRFAAFFGGRGGAATQGGASNKKITLTIGVDDRTNTLVMACTETMFTDIKELVAEMENSAKKAVRVVKVVPIQGVDPMLIQTAVDAIQGRTSSASSSPFGGLGGMRGGMQGGQRGGFGGGGFGGAPGGGFGGGGMGGGGFGGQRGGFGGGGFGGGGMGGGGMRGGMGGGMRGGMGR